MTVVLRLKKLVQKYLMTSIFSIHNHTKTVKQHPLRRISYLAILILAIAVPVGNRKVFASSIDLTAQLYVDGHTLNVATNAKDVQGVIDSAGIELKETTSRKENKKKIISELQHQLSYEKIKETKLILSFKI